MPVLRAGDKLKNGTFVIQSLIGRGGFGEVYEARQPRMDRQVAIKVLAPGLAEEEEVLKRFQREALAAGTLRHPNVLPVFDFDEDEEAGVYFLAMQYVPGSTSLQNLMNGPMDPKEVARIITGIAGALDAAHARGIIHRDVKPPNVLIDEEHRPLLTDFGIAHLQDMTGMTQKGMAIGTPAYVSPEQGMGKPVDAASDQYSLAVMTYQMLAGRPPFTGDSLSLVMQHVNTPPPSLSALNPALQGEIAGVVAKALSKKPEARYATCGEFAMALSAAAAGLAPGGTLVMGPQPEVGAVSYLNPSVAPLPPGSALSFGNVAAGGNVPAGVATVASEAVPAQAGASGGLSSMASEPAVASERAIPRPTGARPPISLMAAGVGAVMLLIVGGIAAKQLTSSPSADQTSSSTPDPVVAVVAPTVPLAPDLGIVEIKSDPTGILTVDGEPAGLTPAALRLKEGEHELKVVAPTYKEWTSRVTAKPGETFTLPPFALEPLPDAEVVLNSVSEAQIGKEPFVDAGQIIRLRTYTEQFQANEDINAIVYLTPKSKGIRDLSMNLTMRWERVGNPPGETTGTQFIDQAWLETFIRACAPAYVLDPGGTNTPLSVSIFVDEVLIKTFSFRIGPGAVTRQSQCDNRDLPGASTTS